MSGINVYPVTAVAALACDRCDERWTSRPYAPDGWLSEVTASEPAFDAGWRVYVGERSQRTYCAEHGPTVPMRQVYPKESR